MGDHIHIQAKPMLSISSNAVQASHGAKIEKIDSEKLLYMTSRGLTPQQAQRLVIQGYFNHIYDQVAS
jgi:Fe-S cluster assembly protein SufD